MSVSSDRRRQLISPHALKAALYDGHELALLDVREAGQFGEGHLFLAVPLPYSRLELDAPRLLPRPGVRIVVYDAGDDSTPDVARRAAAQLHALGYADVAILEGGTHGWERAGFTLFKGVNLPSKSFGELAEHAYHTPRIGADQLARMIAAGEPVAVFDGRPASEFRKMNIPTAVCCPNGELAFRIATLVPDPSTPIVINCAGRTRSIIGAQTLINLGIPNPVYALENGTQGWYLADHALEHGGTARYPDASGTTAWRDAAQGLARRFGVATVDVATAREWAADPRRTLFLCDVRTPEEFARGTLPGAQHTPGGQLLQSTDQYVGVRGARLLLFDDDGVRAPTTASWLRQMGHDASVLAGGLQSGFALSRREVVAPAIEAIDATAVSTLRAGSDVELIDLRSSSAFRSGHIEGARWANRARLAQTLHGVSKPVVLIDDDRDHAGWIAAVDWPEGLPAPRWLGGAPAAWRSAGLSVVASADQPPDADCIDYLFFVHDRHDGNKDAARRYLAWETGLIAQLDANELASFRLPEADPATAPSPTTR